MGINKQYAQTIKPVIMPNIAPLAVARFQKSPPKKAGDSCAIAANETRPIEASAAELSATL